MMSCRLVFEYDEIDFYVRVQRRRIFQQGDDRVQEKSKYFESVFSAQAAQSLKCA